MHKIWAVIRREFVERVRTRAFLLSTILFPLFMAAMVVIPGFLMSRSTGTQRLALVDATTDDLGQRMAASLSAARVGRGLPRCLDHALLESLDEGGRGLLCLRRSPCGSDSSAEAPIGGVRALEDRSAEQQPRAGGDCEDERDRKNALGHMGSEV